MMLKLMCAVALCGSVHRVDGASVVRCCVKLYGVVNNYSVPYSATSYPGWLSTESERNAYRRVLEEFRNILKEQQPHADRGFSVVAADEVQKFQELNPDDWCPICLTPFYEENSSKNVVRTTCNHLYHEECLTEWLAKKWFCPMCRGRLEAHQPLPVIDMSCSDFMTLLRTVEKYQLRGEDIPRDIFLFYLQR